LPSNQKRISEFRVSYRVGWVEHGETQLFQLREKNWVEALHEASLLRQSEGKFTDYDCPY